MARLTKLPGLATRVACIAVTLLSFAAMAAADPLLITSGHFSFMTDGSVGVDLDGPGISFHFADTNPEDFGVPGLAIEHATPADSTLPLGGHILPNMNGQLTINGTTYDTDVQFDLNFVAGSGVAQPVDVSQPCPVGEPPCTAVVARGPFTMTGELTSSFPQLRFALAGQGLATAGFLLQNGDGAGVRAFARYDFSPATAATPEPATLLLVAPAAFLLRRRNTSARR